MAKKPENSDEQPEKKSSNGVAGLLVLAAGSIVSAFAAAYFLSPATPEALVCNSSDPSVGHAEQIAKPEQAYVELQDILITIGSEPATRYLKMKLAIITVEGGTHAVREAEPVLLDAFVNYLRAIELSDFEDPGFYPRMREQLAHRSKLVLGSAHSDGVLITEFLLR